MASDQDFGRWSVPQKGGRACSRAIGTGAEYSHKVANVGVRESTFVRQTVKRRTQATDDTGLLDGCGIKAIGDGNRIVPPDDRAKVTRRRQLMVQAAIDDQEYLAVAYFPVDDAGEIDPRLSNQIAPKLDAEPGLGQMVG